MTRVTRETIAWGAIEGRTLRTQIVLARPSAMNRRLDHDMPRQHLAFILRQDGGTFDYVPQFAHIARPTVLQ